MFAATPLPMFVLDPRVHEVLAANDAALRRYALDPEAVATLDPASLVDPESGAAFRAWARSADGSPTEAFEQQTADGLSFSAEVRVTRLRWARKEARLLIVRDTSGHARMEEHLRQVQKMEAIGRMAGSIAHDFNNLLTAIGGYADLLVDSLPPDDLATEDARQIRSAVERGAALTRRLLAFSRRQLVEAQVVDLNASVEGMRPLLERLLGERTTLVLGLGQAAGAVRIDASALEQVLLNLALNGRDAMPGGGRLLVETARVDLDERYAAARAEVRPGPYALLAVSDEGGGLTDDAREHLFEPFYTTKPRGEGTGLGLATAYGIVRQAGGHIDVFSQAGFGTTFRVYLPSLAVSAAGPDAAGAGVETAPEPAPGAPTHLEGEALVAEDDPAVRRILVQTLRRAGLRVRDAVDGAEALELLASGPIPDIVVSDVRMPRLSGPEMVTLARQRWPDLAVLFLSGHTGEDTPDGVRRAGGRILGKPFGTDELLAAVAEILADRTLGGAPPGAGTGS